MSGGATGRTALGGNSYWGEGMMLEEGAILI